MMLHPLGFCYQHWNSRKFSSTKLTGALHYPHYYDIGTQPAQAHNSMQPALWARSDDCCCYSHLSSHYGSQRLGLDYPSPGRALARCCWGDTIDYVRGVVGEEDVQMADLEDVADSKALDSGCTDRVLA